MKRMFFYFCLCLSTLYFQPLQAQEKADSIVCRGNIIFDAIATDNYRSSHSYPDHVLSTNSNRGVLLFDGEKTFSINCMRGDTLTLWSYQGGFPSNYRVEFIATDTAVLNIHVSSYPSISEGWYHTGEKLEFTNLPPVKNLSAADLTGTYKYEYDYENDAYDGYFYSTLKLQEDGTFHRIDDIFDIDHLYVEYLIGTWEVSKDTLICRPVPKMYPPWQQERYPGQMMSFPIIYNKNKGKISDEPVRKYFIRKKGLRNVKSRGVMYRKIKETR